MECTKVTNKRSGGKGNVFLKCHELFLHCLLWKVNNLSWQNGFISTEEPEEGKGKCGASRHKTNTIGTMLPVEGNRERASSMRCHRMLCKPLTGKHCTDKQIFYSTATLVLGSLSFQTCKNSGALYHHPQPPASRTLWFHNSGMGPASERSKRTQVKLPT